MSENLQTQISIHLWIITLAICYIAGLLSCR